jgi:hypothetical protein
LQIDYGAPPGLGIETRAPAPSVTYNRGVKFSRRSALSVGGVAGLLLLGIGTVRLRVFAPVVPHADFLVLGQREKHTVDALVAALFPADGALPSGESVGLARALDEQIWAAVPAARADMLAALLLLECVPPVFGSLATFSSLDAAARTRVFEAMLRSKRDVFCRVAVGLKQLLSIAYYSAPATWEVLGYDGPWVKNAKPPPSAIRYAHLVSSKQRDGG